MYCGSEVLYLSHPEEMRCVYCNGEFKGYMRCVNGHFICESCHNQDAVRTIKDIAFNTKLSDPMEIAEMMMTLPALPMLGCQHAYIVCGALLSALRNEGCRDITDEDINSAFDRTEKQAQGGYCGLTGICGVCAAVGACVSILTGARCGADSEQALTMDAVIETARAIRLVTGPSCCKAYVRTAIETSVRFMGERMGVALKIKDIKEPCAYIGSHPHGCREQRCPYFNPKTYDSPRKGSHRDVMNVYDEFFSRVDNEGVIDIKTKHLIALGASLGAGCQP